MARLTDYFKRKLASSISRRVNKADRSFELEYVAEVIRLSRVAIVVNVTRRTFSSAGPAYAGEDVYLGDILVPLMEVGGLEDFWRFLIQKADPESATTLILPKPTAYGGPEDMELLEE